MKAMSIISLVFAVIFCLWFLIFIDSNGVSKDEFAPVGIIFSLWTTAFSIVAIVNSFNRKLKE
jgi:ABC-type thiamin/hydroxymethylpyrimidine transport system permease subunit